jgi:hypothetical protein
VKPKLINGSIACGGMFSAQLRQLTVCCGHPTGNKTSTMKKEVMAIWTLTLGLRTKLRVRCSRFRAGEYVGTRVALVVG